MNIFKASFQEDNRRGYLRLSSVFPVEFKLISVDGKDEFSEYVYGATDAGRKRDNNEDYFLITLEKQLYIAADGMGGHNAGEVASLHAAKAVQAYITNDRLAEIRGDHEKIKEVMVKSLFGAHDRQALV